MCRPGDKLPSMNVLLHELKPVPSAAQTEAARVQRHQRQRRQAAMSDSRRALVLEAARSVFAEKGVEGASIREIAKRAGYTPGAIYSYFDSKEAIYAALLAESLERLNQLVSTAKAAGSGAAATLAVAARPQPLLGIAQRLQVRLCLRSARPVLSIVGRGILGV